MNTIYQYKGGGYDGCFWEWNFAFIDKNGKFHDLHSSGRDGAKNKAKLGKRMRNDTSYSYQVDDEKDMLELVTENIAQSLFTIAKPLAAQGIDLKVFCTECGNHTHIKECIADNPVWQGGLAYANKDIICEDCLSEHSCGSCGEYMGSNPANWAESGQCIYCENE